ncbi:MAG TPA: DNA cytosine methyltransferase [Solirubrobacterales bacterium]|nr:DNA cytosine methyltransferase [Solirubrobacterales bacterium]
MARNGSSSDASRRRPVAIDLFAGAGGLSLGFEQAGFDVFAAVEYDPVHCGVHEFNFPNTEIVCADASKLAPAQLCQATWAGAARHGRPDWDGEIDVIVGGPPCQGFSTMGKRLIDDSRNRLVFDFFRLVSALRPRYFVMENVPGMAAGGHTAILQNFLDEFERNGYVAAPKVLNAADYGVPQLRRRLIVMGSREDVAAACHPKPRVNPLPKRPGARTRMEIEGLPKGPTVWQAIGDLPDLDRFDALLETDRVRLPKSDLAAMERKASSYAVSMRDGDPDDLSHRRIWDRQLLTSSARTVHTEVSVRRFAATPPGETEPISRFYRLHPRGLCNTLRAGTGSERGAYTSPRPIHPKLPRVLSVREAARLHSFPDWFQLHSTKWHGFRQIGNAVAPRMGRSVGEAVREALEAESLRPTQAVALGNTELLTMTMTAAAERYQAAQGDIPAPRERFVPRAQAAA